MASHSSGNGHSSTTEPVDLVWPGSSELRRRNSSGSMPSLRASMSMALSRAKWVWGGPAPRAAAPHGLFV